MKNDCTMETDQIIDRKDLEKEDSQLSEGKDVFLLKIIGISNFQGFDFIL